MRNIWTIAKRELKLYFASPIAYVVAFIIFLVIGYLFYSNLAIAALQQFTGGGFVPNAQVVIGPLVTLFLFTTPALTMRTIAEEQRMGTLELLLTAPVRDWEVIVGKWLGAFLYMLLLTLLTLIYPAVLSRLVSPSIDLGLVAAGYLGLLLLEAAFLAIGVMMSSFFSNQIAAFFATLGLLLLVWMFGYPAQSSGGAAAVLRYLDFSEHFYNSFFQGVLELKDIVFYVSATLLALVVGSVAVEARRWR